MLDREAQRRLLDRVAEAAAMEDCLVAPVGSVYYLLLGGGRGLTKDLDTVIHAGDLSVADARTLERVGKRLGDAALTHDGAVVAVRTQPGLPGPDIELVRGRRRAGGGFMPRKLLELAATHAEARGNILMYPPEFVLVLKADAAVDRQARALRDPERKRENEARARAFEADVFDEVLRLSLQGGANPKHLAAALSCLKKSRQAEVEALLRSAGARLEADG